MDRSNEPSITGKSPYDRAGDLDAFYATVSGLNFTLLGLWWVAIKERTDIGQRDATGRRLAYLVSLQFIISGTVSLLSQVATNVPALWRTSFAFAGPAGAVGLLVLAHQLSKVIDGRVLVNVLRFVSGR